MAQTVLRGGLVFDERGGFTRRDVVIEGERFTDAPASDGATVIDASGAWVIPGVYDCHEHITWNDFHAEDRARRSSDEQSALTAVALAHTLRGGILNVRDGGGADAALRDSLAAGTVLGPRLQVAIAMIGREVAGDPYALRAAVDGALEAGAQWVKLIATAGVATPSDSVLESNFTEQEMKLAAERAARGGARLMVHTWGGDSLDWAVEYGAGSVEHGIYLDTAQATRMAAAGVTYVPTLRIYREVREMVLSGELAGVPLQRITDVVERHEEAVRFARDAGVAIGMGCDFSMPSQHGTNLVELAALRRAGLSSEEVLIAATRVGAALFGDEDGGSIAPGSRADAVLLRFDPAQAATFERSDFVGMVIKDGSVT